jgi:hypothetical protein
MMNDNQVVGLTVRRPRLLAYLLLFFSICAGTVSAQKDAALEGQQAKVAKAEAIFQERCKTAGEKIYRTVENVEGIFLLKLRPRRINYGRQFDMDDPYGRDLGGEGYIESFLRGEYQATHTGVPIPGAPPRLGYLYVEALDPKDGQRYRYTGSLKDVEVRSNVLMGGDGKRKFLTKKFVLGKAPASGPPPRYGITYNDISTREDREHWIAGSSLKVIDLKTDEVIAERIGYMMDRGQGSTSRGRSPWLLAANYACPSFQRNPLRPPGNGASTQPYQTLDFVQKVVKPKLEKN